MFLMVLQITMPAHLPQNLRDFSVQSATRAQKNTLKDLSRKSAALTSTSQKSCSHFHKIHKAVTQP
jgi:hypothetical protein